MSTVTKQNQSTGIQRSVAITGVQNSVFCTAVALILWKFIPSFAQFGFWSCFVHSQMIGNSTWLMYMLAPALLQRASLSIAVERVFMLIIIPLVGSLIGVLLSEWILGLSPSEEPNLPIASKLLICATVAIAASFLFTGFLTQKQKFLELELAALEERRRADNARHAMLQAQLEPHMLFNTLANLRALIGSDTHRALDMLDRLDNFLRETLNSSQTPLQTIEHQFNVLDDYLSLINVRFGDRLTYVLSLSDESKNERIPSLLLQPLVENAIKHGIEPSVDGGEVFVAAECSSTHILLTVSDTGEGIHTAYCDPETINIQPQPNQSSGFGLSAIKQRLIGTYGDEAYINIAAHGTGGETGTTVVITIPRTLDR